MADPQELDSASPSAALQPEQDQSHPERAILFIGVSLALGVICRQKFKGTRVPYTVALLILGFGLGAIEYGTDTGLGDLGASIRMWARINPELILFVFLPALLFESSFALEIHQLRRCIMQIVLLACPGVVISTACLALVHRYVFPYGWNWSTCLLLGGLLSATDPVAVVALLKELGASKKLSTIVEGESLMNDGTAIVVFKLFYQMTLGKHFTVGEVVKFFTQTALGAVAVGLGFGLVAVLWIFRVFNDTIVEITLTLTASYMAFFVAEDEASVSGVLTVMTVGIFFAAFARTAFTGEGERSMHLFWEMVAYIANTLIFTLSGTVIAESVLRSLEKIQGQDWIYLVVLYVFLQLSRAVVVAVLYPGLKYFGYGMNWKEALVLIWAGLRGAVALSLSLLVDEVGEYRSGGRIVMTKQTEARFVFFTGGVVLLTLIINGSTTQFLLKFLRMDHTPKTKELILDHVRHEMYSKALESFGELGEDEDLGPADWSTVSKYVSSLVEADSRGPREHPHASSANEEQARKMAFKDTRIRFLNGVQSAYWGMLDEGRITRTAAILLMASVDEALDHVDLDVPIQDWDGVKPHVSFPGCLKWSGIIPNYLLSRLTLQKLELGCYMAAAFLRAHRQAQQHLRDFIGESHIADEVIRESELAGAAATDFLEDVRLSFPQILRVIKTKQVTQAILLNLRSYVTSLEEAGLLEAKETNHLHDNLEVDLKRLHRKPPVIRMRSPFELLSSQPFFGALPAHIQSDLMNCTKETMLLRGNVLYDEDGRSDGVWFISNGNVKWTSTKYKLQHALHPTFTHGSTLGLYEALTGRPHLCTVVADSLVQSFFIDTRTLMARIHDEPGLEEFFWQESALMVTKLVAPQLESVSMQELRALIAEHSYMCTYLRGEVIAIEPTKIGILLEGFVKREGNDVVISSPAGLHSPLVEIYNQRKGSKTASIIPQTVYYQAETRSRVLVLDVQTPERALSFPSMTSVLPHDSSRERLGSSTSLRHRNSHSRLRESTPKSGLLASLEITETPASRFSARALDLSRYGSQVNEERESSQGEHSLVGSHGNRLQQPRVQKAINLRSQSLPENGAQPIENNLLSTEAFTAVKKEVDRRYLEQRKIQSQGHLLPPTPPLVRLAERREAQQQQESGHSSGDSEGEEEHIVEIGSPSSLFGMH